MFDSKCTGMIANIELQYGHASGMYSKCNLKYTVCRLKFSRELNAFVQLRVFLVSAIDYAVHLNGIFLNQHVIGEACDLYTTII